MTGPATNPTLSRSLDAASRTPTASVPISASIGEARALKTAVALGMLLGGLLLLGVGFTQPALIHAVAHDTRHAAGFPCH